MLGLGSVFVIPSVQAETSIESQRTEIQSKVDGAKQLIQELQADKATLEKKLDKLMKRLKKIQQK